MLFTNKYTNFVDGKTVDTSKLMITSSWGSTREKYLKPSIKCTLDVFKFMYKQSKSIIK